MGSAKNLQFMKVPLSKIYVDTNYNIRDNSAYSAENMQELKDSIRAAGGVLSPITVMPLDRSNLGPELEERTEGKEFTVIDGFRRSLMLQELATENPAFGANVPIVITNTSNDAGTFKLVQLISGLQRQQFNPLETARAFRSMIDDSDIKLTQAEVAAAAGIERTRVTQYLKLLTLPNKIQEMMNAGRIQFSHARTLLRAPPGDDCKNWIELAGSAEGMTVEAFERMVVRRYHLDADETVVETKKPDGSTQRQSIKTRKAKDYTDKYKPEFKRRAEEAKKKGDDSSFSLWQHRMDALAWYFCNDESQLSKDLREWEDDVERKETADKISREAAGKKTKYVSALVADIYKMVNTQPDDDNTPRPSFAQALSATKANVELHINKAKESKKSASEYFGFEFKSADAFMDEVSQELKEMQAKKKRAKAVNSAKSVWKAAYADLHIPDLSDEAKAEATKELSAASDVLKKFGVSPDEFEKKVLEEEEAATARKQDAKKRDTTNKKVKVKVK